MEISNRWLKKHNACEVACDWVQIQNTRDELILIKSAMEIDHFDWVNWYLTRRLNKRKKIQYAVFAVAQVLYIYEKNHPGDKAPRKAIEAAEKYLKRPCKATKNAAADASYAAADSAILASTNRAADAADAACSAAYSTAVATWDATHSACSAAAYATYAAADAEIKLQKKIINYGTKLLKR